MILSHADAAPGPLNSLHNHGDKREAHGLAMDLAMDSTADHRG